ncbi:MAG: hypothetical protein AMXMBFR64_45990 [Myxococcales bacterium]
MNALRPLRSLCDVCLEPGDGELRSDATTVALVKRCAEHGERMVPLSHNGDDYLRLDRAFHTLFPPHEPPQPTVDTYYFITNACNLGCGYCLTEANRYPYFEDYPLVDFEQRLRGYSGEKVSLIGGEPLSHPRFFDFVGAVRRARKTLVVYTNGLAFADEATVRRLVQEAGRVEVRMTFEGFEEADYRHLPVGRVRERKLLALDNLERHGVSTVLGHTIAPGEETSYGAAQLQRLLAYAQGHDFVRGLTFQGTAALGGTRDAPPASLLSVDAVMDRVVGALADQAPFPRRQVYVAQKLVYLLARLFDLPICAYVQAALLFRVGDRWVGLDDLVDCDALDARLDRRVERWRSWSRPRQALALAADLLATARPQRLPSLLRLGLETLPVFLRRLDFGSIPRSVLPLVSITICDRYNYDEAVGRRCEKGVQSVVRGQVVTELCSEMAIRQLRERVGGEPAGAPRFRRSAAPGESAGPR